MPDKDRDWAAFLSAQKGEPRPSGSGQPGPTICKESLERYDYIEHKDKGPEKKDD